jgi:hypothetical protein
MAPFRNAGAVERTRPEQGLSDDEYGHDCGLERRERVTHLDRGAPSNAHGDLT